MFRKPFSRASNCLVYTDLHKCWGLATANGCLRVALYIKTLFPPLSEQLLLSKARNVKRQSGNGNNNNRRRNVYLAKCSNYFSAPTTSVMFDLGFFLFFKRHRKLNGIIPKCISLKNVHSKPTVEIIAQHSSASIHTDVREHTVDGCGQRDWERGWWR